MTSWRAWMWCVHSETCCPLGNCIPPSSPPPRHGRLDRRTLHFSPDLAMPRSTSPNNFFQGLEFFFSPKNRPYFGCGIYIYIVDAVKKTRRNITQFLSWQLLPSKFMWKDPWLELCGNLISAAPVKTSPKAVYVIMNTIISNDSNIQISKKKYNYSTHDMRVNLYIEKCWIGKSLFALESEKRVSSSWIRMGRFAAG